ncbi:hypothetical protein PG990_009312 [Apiospora arundinis]
MALPNRTGSWRMEAAYDYVDAIGNVETRLRSRGAQIGALLHSLSLHSSQLSIDYLPTVPMSGDSLIPESQSGWQPHIHNEVFGPYFVVPYDYYSHELGFGGSGILTPEQFTNANQPVLAQEYAGDYGFTVHQGLGWDCAAQFSQYGQLAQPLAQPQTEIYGGRLIATHDSLPPEIMTGSDTSPGHVKVSVVKNRKESARLSAAKCRQKAKRVGNKLEAREAKLRSEWERLEAIKLALEDEKLSLTLEVLRHSRCGDGNIQNYVQSRAGEVAGTAVKANADC